MQCHSCRLPAIWCTVVLATLVLTSTAAPTSAVDDWPNAWLGIRTGPFDGVLSSCSLGAATSDDISTLVWVGVGGSHRLDVMQIGARVSPIGIRFFAAYGCGEPGQPGSMYVERDLGPADRVTHKYTVQLVGPSWQLSIDGRTRLSVPDSLHQWDVQSAQVMHETEGAGDRLGGTPLQPVRCSGSHVRDGTWTHSTWSFFGYGQPAMAAHARFGADWFAIWR